MGSKNRTDKLDSVIEMVNIDTLINYIDTSQERARLMRIKHPHERFEPDEVHIMFDIVKKISDKHKLSSKVLYLNNRITYLALIVRRLRKALDIANKTPELKTIQLRLIEIDIEAFFHISYSLLNVLAKLTPELLDKPVKGLKSESFDKQRNWFMKEENRKADPEYSEYLEKNLGWYEDFHSHRTQLSHHHPLLTYRSVPELILFFDTRERKGFMPDKNVREFIDQKANGIVEFVSFYNDHFGKN